MISGAFDAIELSIKLLAIYSVWLSVLKMMERTGVDKLVSRMLHPITKRLFKGESDDAYTAISLNFACNLLGMGGAATPAGIKAMEHMNKGDSTATPNMILLLVIAATSLQLIPATVIALRATAGSENAADIFFPTLIASGFSTTIGIILCKIFGSMSKSSAKSASELASASKSASKTNEFCKLDNLKSNKIGEFDTCSIKKINALNTKTTNLQRAKETQKKI